MESKDIKDFTKTEYQKLMDVLKAPLDNKDSNV